MLKRKVNGRQWPLVAEVQLDFANDTVVATDGVTKPFTGAALADLIPLPPDATVIGGEVVVDTASNAGTSHTLSIGDSGSATRYANAVDMKTAGRTALTLTGYRHNGEDIRITSTPAGTQLTAGKVSIRVMYVIADRANENQPN